MPRSRAGESTPQAGRRGSAAHVELCFRNTTQRGASIFARRLLLGRENAVPTTTGSERGETSVEAGQRREICLRASGRTHIFVVSMEGRGGAKSFRVHTTQGRGRRLEIVISPGPCISLLDTDPNLSSLIEADDGASLTLSWSPPSPAHSQHMIAEMSRMVLGPCGSDTPIWESGLDRLVAAYEWFELAFAEGEREKFPVTTPSGGGDVRFYRLRLTQLQTAVLAAEPTALDAQTVFDRPSHSANKLGAEQRSVIPVEEVCHGWLRYRAQPGDWTPCWVQQKAANGSWEPAPRHRAGELQTAFFVESGLRLLTMSLAQDSTSSALFLQCTEGFAGMLAPLALLESSGSAIERGLQALMNYVKDVVLQAHSNSTTTSGRGPTLIPATHQAALIILIKLVVARGSISATLQLGSLLHDYPQLVTPEILTEVRKISSIEQFEPATRAFFAAPPGSTEELLDVWESTVFPVLVTACGAGAQDIIDQIVALIEVGELDRAVGIARATLSEESYATLRMPSLEQIAATESACQYQQVVADMEVASHQLLQGGEKKGPDILAYTLCHAVMAARRLRSDRLLVGDGGLPLQQRPFCVDDAAVTNLTTMLSAHISEGGLVPIYARMQRSVIRNLLYLLEENLASMSEQQLLPATDAEKLRLLLDQCLAVDLQQHPEFQTVHAAASSTFAAGLRQLLRTTEAKVVSACDLIGKLAAPPGSELASVDDACSDRSTADTEQRSALRPLGALRAHVLLSVDSQTGRVEHRERNSSCLLHDMKPKIAVGGEEMRSGRHYLELRLDLSRSEVSASNVQGWGRVIVGVVRPNTSLEDIHEAEVNKTCDKVDDEGWVYHPSMGGGIAQRLQQEPKVLQVPWIDTEAYWRSPGSAMADDRCGLLLDCDAGTLDAYKNGMLLGPIFSDVTTPLVWAVAMDAGVSLLASAAYGLSSDTATDIENVIHRPLRLATTKSAPRGTCSPHTASVLTDLGKPANLETIFDQAKCPTIYAQSEELIISAFQQMTSVVKSWKPGSVPVAQLGVCGTDTARPGGSQWTWGNKHSGINLSSERLVATRTSRSLLHDQRGPDYLSVLGSRVFRQGVHEWVLQIQDPTPAATEPHLSRDGGFWVGVCSPELPLGRDRNPETIPSTLAKVWWWYSSGRAGQNFGGDSLRESRPGSIKLNRPIRAQLDCEAGEIIFFYGSRFNKSFRLTGLQGDLVPFVCFSSTPRTALVLSTKSGDVKTRKVLSSPSIGDICCDFVIRAMVPVSNTTSRPRSCDVLLVKEALAFARAVVTHVKTTVESNENFHLFRAQAVSIDSHGSDDQSARTILPLVAFPFQALAVSGLEQVLGTALVLVDRIVQDRVNEDSIAALLLPELISTAALLQDGVKTVPQMLQDPNFCVRAAARTFAFEHKCSLSTAEFYLWSFGGSESNVDRLQALVEFKEASEQPAPTGWRPPVDDHWLTHHSDTIVGLGARCVGVLCAGLRKDVSVDISLFKSARHHDSDQQPASQQAYLALLHDSNVESIRQRWIGHSVPILIEAENAAILAMLSHAGLLQSATKSVNTRDQGAILHASNEALKVKQYIQNVYQKYMHSIDAGAVHDGKEPGTWERAAEPVLERAKLILQFNQCSGSIPKLITDDCVISWETEHAANDEICQRIQRVRQFLVAGPGVDEVRKLLTGRDKAIEEAEMGYSYAVDLLSENFRNDDTFIDPLESSGSAMCVSGVWTIHIRTPGATSTVDAVTKDDDHSYRYLFLEVQGLLIGNAHHKAKTSTKSRSVKKETSLKLTGRIERKQRQATLTWVESEFNEEAGIYRVTARVSATVIGADIVGTRVLVVDNRSIKHKWKGSENRQIVSGRLKCEKWAASSVSSVSEQSDKQSDSHQAVHYCFRGPTVRGRRTHVLQALTKAFDELGPIAEDRVRQASDCLASHVLHLLSEDVSDDVRFWCARFLVTRLNDAGTCTTIASDKRIDNVVACMLRAPKFALRDSSMNCHRATGFLVTVLISRLATLDVDGSVLRRFLSQLFSELIAVSKIPHCDNQQAKIVTWGLCHGSNSTEFVKSLIESSSYFWSAVESSRFSAETEQDVSQLYALQIIMWTLLQHPSRSSLDRLLRLIVHSSVEGVHVTLDLHEATSRQTFINATLMLRKLMMSHPEWRQLFCASLAEAITSYCNRQEKDLFWDHLPPIWAHLSVLGGLLDVVGLGLPNNQPHQILTLSTEGVPDFSSFVSDDTEFNCSGFCDEIAHLLNSIAPSILSRTLQDESECSCRVAFRATRTRFLKVMWELARVKGSTNISSWIPAVAEIARQPVCAPRGCSIEELLAKLWSLYTCTGTLQSPQKHNLTETSAHQQQIAEGTPPHDSSRSIASDESVSVDRVIDEDESIDEPICDSVHIVPFSKLPLLKTSASSSYRSNTFGFKSSGHISTAIAEAENACAVLYARMIVIECMQNANHKVEPQTVFQVVQQLFDADGRLHKLFRTSQAATVSSFQKVDRSIRSWLSNTTQAEMSSIVALCHKQLQVSTSPMSSISPTLLENTSEPAHLHFCHTKRGRAVQVAPDGKSVVFPSRHGCVLSNRTLLTAALQSRRLSWTVKLDSSAAYGSIIGVARVQDFLIGADLSCFNEPPRACWAVATNPALASQLAEPSTQAARYHLRFRQRGQFRVVVEPPSVKIFFRAEGSASEREEICGTVEDDAEVALFCFCMRSGGSMMVINDKLPPNMTSKQHVADMATEVELSKTRSTTPLWNIPVACMVLGHCVQTTSISPASLQSVAETLLQKWPSCDSKKHMVTHGGICQQSDWLLECTINCVEMLQIVQRGKKKSKNDKATLRLTYRLLATDDSRFQELIGQSGTEYIEGLWDADKRTFSGRGVRVDGAPFLEVTKGVQTLCFEPGSNMMKAKNVEDPETTAASSFGRCTVTSLSTVFDEFELETTDDSVHMASARPQTMITLAKMPSAVVAMVLADRTELRNVVLQSTIKQWLCEKRIVYPYGRGRLTFSRYLQALFQVLFKAGLPISMDLDQLVKTVLAPSNTESASETEVVSITEAGPEPAPEPEHEADGADQTIVTTLEAMGFPMNACRRAALRTGNTSIETALEWCFSHNSDPDFNLPVNMVEEASVSWSGAAGVQMCATCGQIGHTTHDCPTLMPVGQPEGGLTFSRTHSDLLVTEDDTTVAVIARLRTEHLARAAICANHVMREGVHEAEFRVVSTGGEMYTQVGICRPRFDPNDDPKPTDTADGWGYQCWADGWLRHAGSARSWRGCSGVPDGTGTILLRLDLRAGTLTVFRDGTELGVAVTNLSGAFCWMTEVTGSSVVHISEAGGSSKLAALESPVQKLSKQEQGCVEFAAALKAYTVACELLFNCDDSGTLPPADWWDHNHPDWKDGAFRSTPELYTLRAELSTMDIWQLRQRCRLWDVDSSVVQKAMRRDPSGQAPSQLAELIEAIVAVSEEGLSGTVSSVQSGLDLAVATDYSAAFDSRWTLKMDSLLLEYAAQRAKIKADSVIDEKEIHAVPRLVGALTVADLFDNEHEEQKISLEQAMRDLQGHNNKRLAPLLDGFAASAIRGRFALLKKWNSVIMPVLAMIDLQKPRTQHVNDYAAAASTGGTCSLERQFWITVARMLPESKAQFIELGLHLTARDPTHSIPTLMLHEPSRSTGGMADFHDTVFEQLFAQLHDRLSALRVCPHLTLTGNGALAMWTNGPDLSELFRASIGKLCDELYEAAISAPGAINGDTSLSGLSPPPLLLPTPNSRSNIAREFGHCHADYQLMPNPAYCFGSEAALERYRFFGALLGSAARNPSVMGAITLDLPSLIWKGLLGEQLTLLDIRLLDVTTASRLERILRYSTADEMGAAEPCYWSLQLLGGRVLVLRGDGAARVSFEERHEYVRVATLRWLAQFTPQLNALQDGFVSCFPELASRLMTWQDLQARVCHANVNVEDLKAIAHYEGAYASGSDEDEAFLLKFWNVLRSMTNQERRDFMCFVSGRPRLPVPPIRPFIIDFSGGADDATLPTARACAFQLNLPRYSSQALLRERLLLACGSCSSLSASFLTGCLSGDDGGGAGAVNLGGTDTIPPSAAPPPMTCCLSMPSNGGGHIETTEAFAERCGLSSGEMRSLLQALRVSDMAGLVNHVKKRKFKKELETVLLSSGAGSSALPAVPPPAPGARDARHLEVEKDSSLWMLLHSLIHRLPTSATGSAALVSSPVEVHEVELSAVLCAMTASPGDPSAGNEAMIDAILKAAGCLVFDKDSRTVSIVPEPSTTPLPVPSPSSDAAEHPGKRDDCEPSGHTARPVSHSPHGRRYEFPMIATPSHGLHGVILQGIIGLREGMILAYIKTTTVTLSSLPATTSTAAETLDGLDGDGSGAQDCADGAAGLGKKGADTAVRRSQGGEDAPSCSSGTAPSAWLTAGLQAVAAVQRHEAQRTPSPPLPSPEVATEAVQWLETGPGSFARNMAALSTALEVAAGKNASPDIGCGAGDEPSEGSGSAAAEGSERGTVVRVAITLGMVQAPPPCNLLIKGHAGRLARALSAYTQAKSRWPVPQPSRPSPVEKLPSSRGGGTGGGGSSDARDQARMRDRRHDQWRPHPRLSRGTPLAAVVAVGTGRTGHDAGQNGRGRQLTAEEAMARGFDRSVNAETRRERRLRERQREDGGGDSSNTAAAASSSASSGHHRQHHAVHQQPQRRAPRQLSASSPTAISAVRPAAAHLLGPAAVPPSGGPGAPGSPSTDSPRRSVTGGLPAGPPTSTAAGVAFGGRGGRGLRGGTRGGMRGSSRGAHQQWPSPPWGLAVAAGPGRGRGGRGAAGRERGGRGGAGRGGGSSGSEGGGLREPPAMPPPGPRSRY